MKIQIPLLMPAHRADIDQLLARFEELKLIIGVGGGGGGEAPVSDASRWRRWAIDAEFLLRVVRDQSPEVEVTMIAGGGADTRP